MKVDYGQGGMKKLRIIQISEKNIHFELVSSYANDSRIGTVIFRGQSETSREQSVISRGQSETSCGQLVISRGQLKTFCGQSVTFCEQRLFLFKYSRSLQGYRNSLE